MDGEGWGGGTGGGRLTADGSRLTADGHYLFCPVFSAIRPSTSSSGKIFLIDERRKDNDPSIQVVSSSCFVVKSQFFRGSESLDNFLA